MREIKFRAWDKVQNVMRSWDWLIDKQCTYFNSKYFDVMQSTGLHDKNGKEIYEGDILKNTTYMTQLVEVYWRGCVKDENSVNGKEWIDWGGWKFRKLPNEKESTFGLDNDKIEVIGNIYENPELIK